MIRGGLLDRFRLRSGLMAALGLFCAISGLATERLSLPGGYLKTDSAGLRLVVPDAQGGARLVLERDGATAAAMRYDPYGTILLEGPDITAVTRKFTGQEHDPSTGLYNYRARLFEPVAGHFISADTLVPGARAASSWNRYAYCGGDPVNFTDPSGHSNKVIVANQFVATDCTANGVRGPEHVAYTRQYRDGFGAGNNRIAREERNLYWDDHRAAVQHNLMWLNEVLYLGLEPDQVRALVDLHDAGKYTDEWDAKIFGPAWSQCLTDQQKADLRVMNAKEELDTRELLLSWGIRGTAIDEVLYAITMADLMDRYYNRLDYPCDSTWWEKPIPTALYDYLVAQCPDIGFTEVFKPSQSSSGYFQWLLDAADLGVGTPAGATLPQLPVGGPTSPALNGGGGTGGGLPQLNGPGGGGNPFDNVVE